MQGLLKGTPSHSASRIRRHSLSTSHMNSLSRNLPTTFRQSLREGTGPTLAMTFSSCRSGASPVRGSHATGLLTNSWGLSDTDVRNDQEGEDHCVVRMGGELDAACETKSPVRRLGRASRSLPELCGVVRIRLPGQHESPGSTAGGRARRGRVLALVKRLGGEPQPKEITAGQPVIGIRLATTRVSDDQLGELRGLSSLRSLDLTQTRISDAGLARLRGHEGLRSLVLLRHQDHRSGVRAHRHA